MQNDCLRIEFDCCCESLDLLENDEELQSVVSWILMMNRLEADSGHRQAMIASDHADASLKVDIPCSESEANEKNARNVVADLLGLFDPAEHRVVRVLHGRGQEVDIAPITLWPRNDDMHHAHRHVRGHAAGRSR